MWPFDRKEEDKEQTPKDFEFALGEEVQETLTGFTGFVSIRGQHLTGCNTYVVERLQDNGSVASETFDEKRLEKIGEAAKPIEPEDFEFEIGDVLVDTVTEFQGTVVTRAQSLTSINSYALTAKNLTGAVSTHFFDENRLKKVEAEPKKEVRAPGARPGGGPLPRTGALR